MAKLEQTQVTNLVGTVVSDDGKTTIASLSTSVSSNPEVAPSYTESINNLGLYYDEIETARQGIDEFNKQRRALEDEMIAKMKKVTPEEEVEEEVVEVEEEEPVTEPDSE